MLTLGFDTSNYTTSVAAFDGVGGKNCSRLLDVKPGELGLRQSDALFAHIKRLPELVDALCASVNIGNVTAIGVSTRPRAVEGSYMPCFLAGHSAAASIACGAKAPLFSSFLHHQFHTYPIGQTDNELLIGARLPVVQRHFAHLDAQLIMAC